MFILDTSWKVLLNVGYFVGLNLMNNKRFKFHPKIVVMIGSSLAIAGVILSSFTKSYYVFVLTYGALNGLGGGMCFMLPL